VKLKGVKVMINFLNNVWGSSNPSVEIINEVTKGNPLLQLLANVILDTLGKGRRKGRRKKGNEGKGKEGKEATEMSRQRMEGKGREKYSRVLTVYEGEQAAQTVILFEDLLSNKLDFLNYCTQWVWSKLTPIQRHEAFVEIFNQHSDP
jgi:hypothetical protein